MKTTITLLAISNIAIWFCLDWQRDAHMRLSHRHDMTAVTVNRLANKDELSSNFIDKDGNLRAPDGNYITELENGSSITTSLWISPDAVMEMRKEAKEARK